MTAILMLMLLNVSMFVRLFFFNSFDDGIKGEYLGHFNLSNAALL
jgi:hypothetical protein